MALVGRVWPRPGYRGQPLTFIIRHHVAAPRGARSQKRAREDFLLALDTACRIYAPAREMCRFSQDSFNESTYQPNVAAKIVGLAFLSAVAAWDDFLESVYLGYLSGYPAPSGYLPVLRSGPALNKAHALLLAAGEANPEKQSGSCDGAASNGSRACQRFISRRRMSS